jgi:hypothetical protein
MMSLSVMSGLSSVFGGERRSQQPQNETARCVRWSGPLIGKKRSLAVRSDVSDQRTRGTPGSSSEMAMRDIMRGRIARLRSGDASNFAAASCPRLVRLAAGTPGRQARILPLRVSHVPRKERQVRRASGVPT